MQKAFIAGALLPTGGAYMAYHVGRLLARHFGYELYDVAMAPPEKRLFEYDTPMATISKEEMEHQIKHDDLLIVNPAFSEYLYGLRLPGRKIMYVQGFRKLLVMDCHCDLYVSVSQMVSRHIHTLYNISSPVIPAFVQLNMLPKTLPWYERPAGSALVYAKDNSADHQNLYQYVYEKLYHQAPDIDISKVLDGRELSREQFLEKIGSVRYLINLSLAEGFGLVPLEAMAMGTCVLGLDGLSGRDYMQIGHNCLVESMTDLRALPDSIINAFRDERLASACAENGKRTAANYGHGPFKKAWLRQLAQFLQRAPNHA